MALDEELLASINENNEEETDIEFFNNELHDDDILILAEALKKNTSVIRLDLGDNPINLASAKALAEMLKMNRTLKCLNLNISNLECFQVIADVLKQNSSVLTSMFFANCQFGDNGMSVIAEVLKTNTSLQQIQVVSDTFSPQGIERLAIALKTNKVIHDLELIETEIGAAGAMHLANMLHVNTTLKHLCIDDNNIGDRGAKAIAKSLTVNSTLESLHVSENNIGVIGAIALAQALQNNHSLQSLYLSNNAIGAAGAVNLVKNLNHKKNFVLDLNGNNIGDAGFAKMAQLLKSNSSIGFLNVSNNQISDESVVILAKALKTNTTLYSINLGGDPTKPIREKSVIALIDALQTNTTVRYIGFNWFGMPVLNLKEHLDILTNRNQKIGDITRAILQKIKETNDTLSNSPDLKQQMRDLQAEMEKSIREIAQLCPGAIQIQTINQAWLALAETVPDYVCKQSEKTEASDWSYGFFECLPRIDGHVIDVQETSRNVNGC